MTGNKTVGGGMDAAVALDDVLVAMPMRGPGGDPLPRLLKEAAPTDAFAMVDKAGRTMVSMPGLDKAIGGLFKGQAAAHRVDRLAMLLFIRGRLVQGLGSDRWMPVDVWHPAGEDGDDEVEHVTRMMCSLYTGWPMVAAQAEAWSDDDADMSDRLEGWRPSGTPEADRATLVLEEEMDELGLDGPMPGPPEVITLADAVAGAVATRHHGPDGLSSSYMVETGRHRVSLVSPDILRAEFTVKGSMATGLKVEGRLVDLSDVPGTGTLEGCDLGDVGAFLDGGALPDVWTTCLTRMLVSGRFATVDPAHPGSPVTADGTTLGVATVGGSVMVVATGGSLAEPVLYDMARTPWAVMVERTGLPAAGGPDGVGGVGGEGIGDGAERGI